jgi:hypothetical protein
MRLALGKCMGPCVDVTIRDEYRAMVHQVIRFLDGDDDALYQVLWAALEQAAERQDFERAEKLRRNLTVVNGIVDGQRELRQAVEAHHLVMVAPSPEPGQRELWLVVAGRIWARTAIGPVPADDAVLRVVSTAEANEPPVAEDRLVAERSEGYAAVEAVDADHLAGRLLASWRRYREAGMVEVSRDTLDDAYILNRWIAAHSDHPALFTLDRERTAEHHYWREIVERARFLPEDALALDVTGAGAHGRSDADARVDDVNASL